MRVERYAPTGAERIVCVYIQCGAPVLSSAKPKQRFVESQMLIADLLHSCSNADVARAAVASIGGGFAERVAAAAGKNGMEVGRFVAVVVRGYARRANRQAMVDLNRSIRGADHPLLRGLAHVLEPALENGETLIDDEDMCFSLAPIWSYGCERLQ